MADLLLKTLGRDLNIDTGDLQIVTGPEAIAQHLRIRFRFFFAEWFLDRRLGVPYFQRILIKNPGTNVVRSIMRKVITATPGVLALISLDTVYEGEIRKLTVRFEARIEGSDVPLEFVEEFII
jgi:hypothetical protein